MTALRSKPVRRRVQRAVAAAGTTADGRRTAVVLLFVRRYRTRVGIGGIFQLLGDSRSSHAYRS